MNKLAKCSSILFFVTLCVTVPNLVGFGVWILFYESPHEPCRGIRQWMDVNVCITSAVFAYWFLVLIAAVLCEDAAEARKRKAQAQAEDMQPVRI